MGESELEKEAEDLERQARIEKDKKNYDLAVLLLEDAKDIYLQLGFKGSLNSIEKKILDLNKIIEYERQSGKITPSEDAERKKKLEEDGNQLLKEARDLANEKDADGAIKLYNKALRIFEKLNFDYQCKRIKWEISKLKSSQVAGGTEKDVYDDRVLSIAEKRKQRIQLQLEEKKQQESMTYQQKVSAFKEEKTQQQRVLTEREKKMQMLAEKKRREEELTARADEAMDIGKSLVDNKEFDDAKIYYKEAIEIFAQLGWKQQVDVLNSELRNIDKYKEEYQKKLEQDALKIKAQEEKFQKRVDSILAEKKKEEKERLARLKALSPELKRKIETARLALKKAEKELELKKYQRVLGRYEYALELYGNIPKDKIDLTNDISDLESKIAEVKKQLDFT